MTESSRRHPERQYPSSGREKLSEEGWLKLGYPGTDTASEMCDAILEGAFPNTARRIEEFTETAAEEGSDEWVPSAEDLKEAVVQDIVDQQAALVDRGVTFDEDGRLVPIRIWYFLRRGRGKFARVDGRAVRDFIFGRSALHPEKDGLVRLATVTIVLEEGEPVEIQVDPTGYKLRTRPDGFIIDAHRADAFAEDASESAALFAGRRDEAVRCDLSDAEAQAVLKAAQKVIDPQWPEN